MSNLCFFSFFGQVAGISHAQSMLNVSLESSGLKSLERSFAVDGHDNKGQATGFADTGGRTVSFSQSINTLSVPASFNNTTEHRRQATYLTFH